MLIYNGTENEKFRLIRGGTFLSNYLNELFLYNG